MSSNSSGAVDKDFIKMGSKNICNLRETVLRICKNHITAVVGGCSLAGKSDPDNPYN